MFEDLGSRVLGKRGRFGCLGSIQGSTNRYSRDLHLLGGDCRVWS